MNSKSNFLLYAGLIVLVLAGIYGLSVWQQPADGKYDAFASCTKEKGAVFYGAFWCPHCQNQKKLFGSGAKNLNYVECSMPDGQSRTPACIDKKIEGYPTWEFADGSRMSGEVSLEKLAEKTGCVLPQN